MEADEEIKFISIILKEHSHLTMLFFCMQLESKLPILHLQESNFYLSYLDFTHHKKSPSLKARGIEIYKK